MHRDGNFPRRGRVPTDNYPSGDGYGYPFIKSGRGMGTRLLNGAEAGVEVPVPWVPLPSTTISDNIYSHHKTRIHSIEEPPRRSGATAVRAVDSRRHAFKI
ncbi:hypothetical protein PIB30_020413 [Stylosanthes scabra]|uniref:Uncharacterized protein n=1 Tax=Stylosanthes scabra TaxID=79078 RepID=A0ABU6S8T2_9FABA|nr:hypothetical protein [Stylosanthes scabra]